MAICVAFLPLPPSSDVSHLPSEWCLYMLQANTEVDVESLAALHHPHLATILGVVAAPPSVRIILPAFQPTTLATWLNR